MACMPPSPVVSSSSSRCRSCTHYTPLWFDCRRLVPRMNSPQSRMCLSLSLSLSLSCCHPVLIVAQHAYIHSLLNRQRYLNFTVVHTALISFLIDIPTVIVTLTSGMPRRQAFATFAVTLNIIVLLKCLFAFPILVYKLGWSGGKDPASTGAGAGRDRDAVTYSQVAGVDNL
eukprot:TRINITY_DN4758_c0_g1_i10.p1 TRINITY_DN4758_c0_g1~~TRINITY_DN4758_c0_g1_i10.p1  ORF type:complete len:172 (+),score=14.07 TRINITY_DN4758_c0_g1_i10:143-658(+)